MATEPRALSITLDATTRLSALLTLPRQPHAAYVLAHGAGAGMAHPFLASVAEGLAQRGVATLRFNFPSMERGLRRVDPPAVAQAAVRAAVLEARRALPGVPLFSGGKSFGGRMSSQAEAAAPLDSIRGLAFLGFPLHPAGKPSAERSEHLSHVAVPMLFLQGSRDALAQLELLRPVVKRLGSRATLAVFEEADHSFHVPRKTGRTDAEVLAEVLDTLAAWMEANR
jgi:hypothetical protein